MKRALSVTLASVLLATSAVGSIASAQPRHERFQQRDNYVQNYCSSHRWDNDCRDWRSNRNQWDESRYQRWYRNHHRDRGPDNAAAAIFGFAAGALSGAIRSGAAVSHAAACEARYRSYDFRTDTFLGYDGQRHYCRL